MCRAHHFFQCLSISSQRNWDAFQSGQAVCNRALHCAQGPCDACLWDRSLKSKREHIKGTRTFIYLYINRDVSVCVSAGALSLLSQQRHLSLLGLDHYHVPHCSCPDVSSTSSPIPALALVQLPPALEVLGPGSQCQGHGKASLPAQLHLHMGVNSVPGFPASWRC